MRESDILNQVIRYLHYRPGKYWRQNTGAFKVQEQGRKSRFIRFNVPGAADITGIREGQRIEIEVKRPGGKLTDKQKAFGEMIKSEGGKYLVVYGVEDLQKEGI